MSSNIHRFELMDNKGNAHEYMCQAIPPEKAMPILCKSLSALGKPLGDILDGLKPALVKILDASPPSQKPGELMQSVMDGVQVKDLLKELDCHRIGAGLAEFGQGLLAAGGMSFCKELLEASATGRKDNDGNYQHLWQPATITMAFTGNLKEFVTALAKVWMYNYSDFLPVSLGEG